MEKNRQKYSKYSTKPKECRESGKKVKNIEKRSKI